MKTTKALRLIAIAYGIIITALMLIVFGMMLIGELAEKGAQYFTEILRSSVRWYDDPTGFFLTYVIGYAIIWWKPWIGSMIILAGGLLFFLVNPSNMGFVLIYLLPTAMVSVLYILYLLLKEPVKNSQS